MQNKDILLENLINDYKKKIIDTINLLNSKIVALDLDGTLTEFKYDNKRLLPCKDDDLEIYSKTNNIYINAKTLKTMKYIINKLNHNDIYIITVTKPTLIEYKLEFITTNFPNIKKENIFQVKNAEEKLKILEQIYLEKNKKICFVEDTTKTLLNAEEKFPFIKGLHISSLIP